MMITISPVAKSHSANMNPEKKNYNKDLKIEKKEEKPLDLENKKNIKVLSEAENIVAKKALEARAKEQELLAELRRRMQKL